METIPVAPKQEDQALGNGSRHEHDTDAGTIEEAGTIETGTIEEADTDASPDIWPVRSSATSSSPAPRSPSASPVGSPADTSSVFDLHPVEVAAHTLLTSSLDHLHENFQQLSQSQVILFTKLRLIEQRLQGFETVMQDNNELFNEVLVNIKLIKQKLAVSLKALKTIDTRVELIEKQVL